MTIDELEQKQKKLQQQANDCLIRLGIIETLSQYGEVSIVGSVAAELMTWPDIDIEVITNKLPNRQSIAELAKFFFSKPEVERMVLLDNTNEFNKSYASGIHIMLEEKVWKIDIWFFLHSEENTGKKKLKKLLQQLTPEYRKTILLIKSQIDHHPKYRKEIFSVDVYNAVLNNEVKTMDAFEQYINKSKRTLYYP